MTQSQIEYDLLVIGGGINGAGIAADAAGRGLKVALCEKSDLASATSWASTKLIHGGLRYLENYEFSLVRKSLQEREILTSLAPHLIRPMAFHIPQLPYSRNSFLIWAGLFLYDNLAKRQIYKGSRRIRLGADSPLNTAISSGFEYWDGFADDTRLVVSNAMQARKHGADILTRTECRAVTATETGWCASLVNSRNQLQSQLNCKAVVNAAGPWVSKVMEQFSAHHTAVPLRLVKGSHIIVPKIYEGDQAYLLQHHDGRVIFVIPYLGKFSLVGTTEQEFTSDLENVSISNAEISYLLSMVNLYFKKSTLHSDVKFSFAGVRPLIDEAGASATEVSRDYKLVLATKPHPLLTIYGGKITTYRLLAEEAVDMLAGVFPTMKPTWTRKAKLPGGDFDVPENLFQDIVKRHVWLGKDLISRWYRSYGTATYELLQEAASMADLGIKFGHNLYQREVDYLCQREWAGSADDILFRRSKLGYFFSESERARLEEYVQQTYSTP